MPKKTVKLEDAPRYFETMGREVQEVALKGLYFAGLRGAQEIVGRIIPSRSPQPVDRGVYRAGWGPSCVTRVGNRVFIENREKVAPLIEYGVRAENIKIGRAMLRALAEWALRKGYAKDPKDAQRMAWGIAIRMKKRGIFNRGRKRQGLEILKELVERRLPKIIKEEVAHQVKRALNA